MITLVTALYDLNRESLEGDFHRSFQDHYVEKFKWFLKIDQPKIVFCDESLNEIIGDNAYIINRPLSFLRDTIQYPLIQKLRNKDWWGEDGWLQHSPQARLEYYNALVMNKPFFMWDATHVLDSDYYLWLDGGFSHTTSPDLFKPPFEEKIVPYLDKLLFLVFDYRYHDIHGFPIEKMDVYAAQEVKQVVRAMMWGGPKDLIQGLVLPYTRIMKQTLEDGYMGTEENLLTLYAYQNPENVNLHTIEGGFIRDFLERIR